MDQELLHSLKQLALEDTSCIELATVETPELLRVKETRTKGEYCWTLTPFSILSVFKVDSSVQRVTYIDADTYFLGDPLDLIGELSAHNKGILVTEHGYAPEYDASSTAGRFCVQFITCVRKYEALNVIEEWGANCIEWCYARYENGKFGDQKYLDEWPEKYPAVVHVLKQVDRTLAPWNVYFFAKRATKLNPVFYHFHGLRLLGSDKVQLYSGYRIGALGRAFYRQYLHELSLSLRVLRKNDIRWSPSKLGSSWIDLLKRSKKRILRTIEFGRLDPESA